MTTAARLRLRSSSVSSQSGVDAVAVFDHDYGSVLWG